WRCARSRRGPHRDRSLAPSPPPHRDGLRAILALYRGRAAAALISRRDERRARDRYAERRQRWQRRRGGSELLALPVAFEQPDRLGRWACGAESQPLQRAKQANPIGEGKPRRELNEFVRRGGIGEQYRDAAAVLRALHIDLGVADQPDIATGGDAAPRQREMHRLAGRLVGGGVPGPDDAAEKPRPAELLDFAAQQRAGLVADDAEKDAPAGE